MFLVCVTPQHKKKKVSYMSKRHILLGAGAAAAAAVSLRSSRLNSLPRPFFWIISLLLLLL